MAARGQQGGSAVLPLASTAVRQIREKGYAAPYKGDRHPVTLVGVNFRAAKRNIDEPVMVELKS